MSAIFTIFDNFLLALNDLYRNEGEIVNIREYEKSILDYAIKVREAAKQGRLAFFVGSGVSKISNYPSWNDLIHKFDQKLNEFDGSAFDSEISYTT